jgi:uncharacterized protein (TIRG00374 family)
MSHSVAAISFGTFISIVFLYYSIHDLNWVVLFSEIKDIKTNALLYCVSATLASYLLRGLRWATIAHRITLKEWDGFTRAVLLGAFANQVLPLRIGEVVRIYSAKRLLPTSLSLSLMSALLDRLSDVLVLLSSALLVVFVISEDLLRNTGLIKLSFILIIGLFVILYLFHRAILKAIYKIIDRWLSRWAVKSKMAIDMLLSLIKQFRRPKNVGRLILIVILVLLIDYLCVMSAINAVGLDLPMGAPLLLWVILAMGSSIPSAPSNLGVYQAAAVWGLSYYQVSSESSIAVSLILQVVTLIVTIMFVLPDLINKGWKKLMVIK